MSKIAKKVLIVEPGESRASVLEGLLQEFGYEPVVHVAEFSEDIWDWVLGDNFMGVVTWHQNFPVTGKRLELQKYVHEANPNLPVLAITADLLDGVLYFDSEFHFTGVHDRAKLKTLIAEHLAGACATCALYRS